MTKNNTRNKNKKVVLGLSGGVDSTAAALILKEGGYEVTGYFFDTLGNQKHLVNQAKKVADQANIDFITENLSEIFSENIIDYFCKEYINGRTPSPCIKCNKEIKFKYLLKTANAIGAANIATGHYARVYYNELSKISYIQKADNIKKDQSYMLYRLDQDILSRLVLPLGDVATKDDVRSFVKYYEFENAGQKDSLGNCFLNKDENEDYISYILKKGMSSPKGNFIDKEGNILGEHQGILHYTIGQRKGLGITFGKPVFVTHIDPKFNTVTLGDEVDIYTSDLFADNFVNADPKMQDVSIFWKNSQKQGRKLYGKIRYSAPPAEITNIDVIGASGTSHPTINETANGVHITFKEPQRAVTPGQSIVFYQNDLVIGGGIIK